MIPGGNGDGDRSFGMKLRQQRAHPDPPYRGRFRRLGRRRGATGGSSRAGRGASSPRTSTWYPEDNPDGDDELFAMNLGRVRPSAASPTPPAATTWRRASPPTARRGLPLRRRLRRDDPDHHLEVFRMDTDGSHLVQVTSSSGGFGAPWVVSPDGAVIAIGSGPGLVPGATPTTTSRSSWPG